MRKILLLTSTFLVLPAVAFAQSPTLGPIYVLVTAVNRIAAMLIPLLIVAAMVCFFWGLVKYVRGGKKFAAAGKNIMIAGIVSLFVMVSIWGIIKMAQSALGIDKSSPVTVPAIPGTRVDDGRD